MKINCRNGVTWFCQRQINLVQRFDFDTNIFFSNFKHQKWKWQFFFIFRGFPMSWWGYQSKTWFSNNNKSSFTLETSWKDVPTTFFPKLKVANSLQWWNSYALIPLVLLYDLRHFRNLGHGFLNLMRFRISTPASRISRKTRRINWQVWRKSV